MNYCYVNELCYHKHTPSQYAVKLFEQVKDSLHLSTQRHSGSLGLALEVGKNILKNTSNTLLCKLQRKEVSF